MEPDLSVRDCNFKFLLRGYLSLDNQSPGKAFHDIQDLHSLRDGFKGDTYLFLVVNFLLKQYIQIDLSDVYFDVF